MRWLLVLLVLLGFPSGAAAAWSLPVDAPVVGRFHVSADRFAAGQRRGVDLAARPGDRVVAPCSGRVAFAGRVPRFGWGVSLRCGRSTATVLGLREVAVRGGWVGRGGLLGVAAGRVRLGARLTGDPFGYRDPLALIGDESRRDRPPLVGPHGARPPRPFAGRAPAPTATHPVAAPGRSAASAPAASDPAAAFPPLAWIGLALIACALPGGALAWRVRRSRAPLRALLVRFLRLSPRKVTSNAGRWSARAPK